MRTIARRKGRRIVFTVSWAVVEVPGGMSEQRNDGSTPDAAEFRALYQAHADTLLRFAARRVGPDTAEDLVSEVFIRAFRKLSPEVMTNYEQSRVWLFRVLRNLIISMGRHDAVVAAKLPLIANRGQPPDHDDSDLLDRLVELPDRQRTVLELRFVEDLDVRTVAAIVEMSEEAVRALTYRALTQLRLLLNSAKPLEGQP
jgi:RNA polymerase sigma factor (sigma-70 family)